MKDLALFRAFWRPRRISFCRLKGMDAGFLVVHRRTRFFRNVLRIDEFPTHCLPGDIFEEIFARSQLSRTVLRSRC